MQSPTRVDFKASADKGDELERHDTRTLNKCSICAYFGCPTNHRHAAHVCYEEHRNKDCAMAGENNLARRTKLHELTLLSIGRNGADQAKRQARVFGRN